MRRRLIPAALGLVCSLFLPAWAREVPEKVVQYDISVELDPKSKTVDGKETLHFKNPSRAKVAELKFHLYWNAFRNSHSTFFLESGENSETIERTKRKAGALDVLSILSKGRNLLPTQGSSHRTTGILKTEPSFPFHFLEP